MRDIAEVSNNYMLKPPSDKDRRGHRDFHFVFTGDLGLCFRVPDKNDLLLVIATILNLERISRFNWGCRFKPSFSGKNCIVKPSNFLSSWGGGEPKERLRGRLHLQVQVKYYNNI